MFLYWTNKVQIKLFTLLVRQENFSSFGCEGLACVFGQPNVLKCAAGKKKLKMWVGKNFKNIRVGFECRLVGLCQVVKELSS